MDAKDYIKEYSEEIEKYKNRYFEKEIVKASKVDKIASDALEILENYMTGGKCLRGGLTILGYQITGGTSLKNILPAALAVELMHNALLIHDDYVDNDKVRRGKPTVHEIYKKGKNEHYGASMAIIVADVAIFSANKLLAELNFSKKLVAEAISGLNHFLLNTGFGELMDIGFDFKPKITWNDILKVRIYKTAHYTFIMPLVVGATLGGADNTMIAKLAKYGEPVGLAFQLRDDVLGVFGDPAKTGKSNDSDIKEGKKTLLYLKSLELTKGKKRDFLEGNYGSGSLNQVKVEKIRRIMKEGGAFDYSQETAGKFVEKGKKYIPSITKNSDLTQTLTNLADYVIFRDK